MATTATSSNNNKNKNNTTTTTATTTNTVLITKTNLLLLLLVIVQWIFFTIILNSRYDRESMTVSRLIALESKMRVQKHHHHQQQQQQYNTNKNPSSMNINDDDDDDDTKIQHQVDGVYVTFLYRAPKWFHLRYKAMIDNALMNIINYPNWKMQIFINEEFIISSKLYHFHPGLYRLLYNSTLANNKIIITPIPKNLTKSKNKPKDVLYSIWFWNSLISDSVIFFSGNGAFCGNSIIEPILFYQNNLIANQIDYCGTPWRKFYGMGGDGSTHSYRNRTTMLRVLQYYYKKYNTSKPPTMTESDFFVETIIQINKEIQKRQQQQQQQLIRLASIEQTYQFGGTTNISRGEGENLIIQHIPIVVSGIHAHLTYSERDTLLKHCPESKIIFPSMHEPTCFGAHPNPLLCKASICALQDKIPKSGC